LAYFDLYDLQRIHSAGEIRFRLLLVLGILSILLAGLSYLFPDFMLGEHAFLFGLFILTPALFAWRWIYDLLMRLPYLQERVYVLGSGERAKRLVETLRARPELGIKVVGSANPLGGVPASGEAPSANLPEQLAELKVRRVIVALSERRGSMPVRELLELRMGGMRVEDATAMIEKISGKIEVEGLYPSALIFSEGFPLNSAFLLARRLVSFLVSLLALLVLLPLFPLIAVAIRLTSEGPVFYRQKRVGRNGVVFTCYKFRTMQLHAETENSPQWATDDDPRITRVGYWLRRSRLDETPQLLNVLLGDMGFVGPRPERPEFVEWLAREIPYYHLRHVIRPGITGWAQVRYQYGASLEESQEKLKYDLYYVKHMSLSLDLLILLYSIKVVLLGRGSR
jgi:sugar transferase (PEP-CTERM system associated)